jgi:hypothetical protein
MPPIGEVIRGILPFLILLLIVLAIITYVPSLTMWLPNTLFGPRGVMKGRGPSTAAIDPVPIADEVLRSLIQRKYLQQRAY